MKLSDLPHLQGLVMLTTQLTIDQWLFLVPLKGGRDYITPQKAIYKWYISGIYCQLGDYMLPTTC